MAHAVMLNKFGYPLERERERRWGGGGEQRRENRLERKTEISCV